MTWMTVNIHRHMSHKYTTAQMKGFTVFTTVSLQCHLWVHTFSTGKLELGVPYLNSEWKLRSLIQECNITL